MQVTAVVVFIETTLFMINCLLKYLLRILFKENAHDYWDELRGFK